MSNYQQDFDTLNDFIDLSAKQNLITEMFLSTIDQIRKYPEIKLNDALINACIDLGIEPDEEPTESLLSIPDGAEEIFLEEELYDEADRLDSNNQIEEFIDVEDINNN